MALILGVQAPSDRLAGALRHGAGGEGGTGPAANEECQISTVYPNPVLEKAVPDQ